MRVTNISEAPGYKGGPGDNTDAIKVFQGATNTTGFLDCATESSSRHRHDTAQRFSGGQKKAPAAASTGAISGEESEVNIVSSHEFSTSDALQAAQALHLANCAVLPVKADGSKAPALGSWTQYRAQRPDAEQLVAWFTGGHPGLGVITGQVSGNLELLEFEGRAVSAGLHETFKATLDDDELWQIILNGYMEQSPSGGLHLFYRVNDEPVSGNTKLAQRHATDDELTSDEWQRLRDKGVRARRVLIETRGEGGYVVVAPSSGTVHESGRPWRMLAGGPATIPVISGAQRDALHIAAHQLDELPPPEPIPDPQPVSSDPGELKPGDDYSARGSWHELLPRHGWSVAYESSDRTMWTRPGKRHGVSAYTYRDGQRLMSVFSTSTELPSDGGLSLYRVYAMLEHGGDWSAAAAQLRRDGYGGRRPDGAPLQAIQFSAQPGQPQAQQPASNRLTFQPASSIQARRVRWLWQHRVAVGSLALLAGREGIGKSTVAYQLAADVTRGTLPGEYHGNPRSVAVVASEDSWAHTIVPRLMAAGADLDRVFRVAAEHNGLLSLPNDIRGLTDTLQEYADTVLVLLDPLMSRMSASLDAHRDGEVRQALEPLVSMADARNVTLLGLIHLNKSTKADPLTMVMGSRAFSAVARAVLFVARDPNQDNALILGQEKNNLGRMDLPTLSFTIENTLVANTADGAIYSGKIKWLGNTDSTIGEALEVTSNSDKMAIIEAQEWLVDYLASQGGVAESKLIKKAARAEGHAESTLKRAKQRAKVVVESSGWPRKTWWRLPEQVGSQQSAQVPGERSE